LNSIEGKDPRMQNHNDVFTDSLSQLSPAQRWVVVGAGVLVFAALGGALALAIGKNGMLVAAKGSVFAIGSAAKLLATRS
jgi:hypothetical protein